MDTAEAIKKGDELITEAVTALSKPLNAPTMSGVDTSQAKKELERARTSRDASAEAIDIEKVRYNEATKKEQDALIRIGEASADRITADAARAQEAANVHSFYADLFGINRDPSSEIATLAVRMREDRAAAMTMQDEIRSMQSVGILDDPLEYLANTLQLPSKIAAYNNQVQKVNNQQRTIDSGIASAQAASAEVVKTIPSITAAQAAADAEKVRLDAVKLSAQADQKLAGQNVDFATKKLSADLSIANATRETTSLELTNKRAVYESQINAVRIAENHAQRLLSAGKLINELGQTAALDKLLANYDINMGNPPGTTNRFLFNRLSDDQQKNMAAIGAGSGGSDPFEFLTNMIKARPGPEMAPAKRDFIAFLSEEASKIKIDPTIPKELHAKRYAEELKKVIEAQKEGASKGGLFHEISPDKMILSGLVAPDSQFAKIIEPLTKQPGPMTPDIMAKTVLAGYNGNITVAGQALAEYYAKNVSLINTSIPLSMAGVKPMDKYTVRIRGAFITTPPFDITKPDQATKYILMLQRQDAQMEAMKGIGKFN